MRTDFCKGGRAEGAACREGEGLILGNGLVEIFGAPLTISGGFAEAADRGRIADLLSRA